MVANIFLTFENHDRIYGSIVSGAACRPTFPTLAVDETHHVFRVPLSRSRTGGEDLPEAAQVIAG